jgi:hypothetical protein
VNLSTKLIPSIGVPIPLLDMLDVNNVCSIEAFIIVWLEAADIRVCVLVVGIIF